MPDFEYLLRFVLNSRTLELVNKKKCANSQQKMEFLARFKKNDIFYSFFRKKDKNTVVPLFNLPIDFEKTHHNVLYGMVAAGKTIYANKAYGCEFSPPEGFDSFVVFDNDLKTICDYDEQDVSAAASPKQEKFEIKFNDVSPANKNDSFEIDKNVAKEEFLKLMNEYKGNRINDEAKENLEKYAIKTSIRESINGLIQNNYGKKTKERNCSGENNLEHIVDGDVDVKRFSYIIKDPARILPLYELEFSFDKAVELKSKKSNLCERCQKKESKMFCVAERASFCEECDQKLHYDSFTRRHTRHYFSNLGGNKKFFNCKDHVDTVVDYFCKECNVPLCTQCRLSGCHPPNHTLVTYLQANEMADDLKDEITFSEEEIKNKKCLSLLKTEIDRFRSNITEIRSLLDRQYKNIINELDVYTNKKYQIFNAKYLEIYKENKTLVFTREFINALDNSDIIQNYRAILEQKETLKVKEDPKVKYKGIYLNGLLSLQAAESSSMPRKKNLGSINKSKEFYAESSESRIDRY